MRLSPDGAINATKRQKERFGCSATIGIQSTKTDEKAGRQRSRLMWMESYETYLKHLIGEEEGARNEHLRFS